MTCADTYELDLDLMEDEAFDPLADDGFGDDEEVDFPIADGSNLKMEGIEPCAPVPARDDRPAEVRIAELFKRMAPRRKTLLKILSFCLEKQPVAEVGSYIAELKRSDKSVFTANDLCSLLERAGAIVRVGEDGAPYVEEEVEPRTVVVDGVEYLEPGTPAPAFWLTTEQGRAQVQAEDPAGRLQELFESEPQYLPIYKRILTLCSAAAGATAKAIAKAVDKDDLLRSPRMYSSRFVEKLHACDALAWGEKVWLTAPLGLEALEQLAGVQDEETDKIAAAIER